MQKKLVAVLVKPKILAWFITGFPAAFDGLLTNENRKKRKLETLAKTQGKSGWKRKKPGSKLSAKSCKKSLHVGRSSTSLFSTWNLHKRLNTWADFPLPQKCPVMGSASRRDIAKRGRSSVKLLVASALSATLWRDDTVSRTCRTRSKGASPTWKTICGFRPWRLRSGEPSQAVSSGGMIPATSKMSRILAKSFRLPATCRKSSSGCRLANTLSFRNGWRRTARCLKIWRSGFRLWCWKVNLRLESPTDWAWQPREFQRRVSLVRLRHRETSAWPVGLVGTKTSRTSTTKLTEKMLFLVLTVALLLVICSQQKWNTNWLLKPKPARLSLLSRTIAKVQRRLLKNSDPSLQKMSLDPQKSWAIATMWFSSFLLKTKQTTYHAHN